MISIDYRVVIFAHRFKQQVNEWLLDSFEDEVPSCVLSMKVIGS